MTKRNFIIFLCFTGIFTIGIIIYFGLSKETKTTNTTNINLSNNNTNMSVVKLETTKGDIILELYNNDAPKTVENFISLVNKGFYNGIIFHRVISGFMIQGGDPTGTGTGGPGYKFADELNANTASYQRGYERGTLAMANSGPNTNGSQFFIMHQEQALPHSYTIFGQVKTGLDTVDAIATVETDANDKPKEDVVITKAEIIDRVQ